MKQVNPNGAFQEVMVKGHLNNLADVSLEIDQETDVVDKAIKENYPALLSQPPTNPQQTTKSTSQFEASPSFQEQIQLLKNEILEKNQEIAEKNQEILELRSKLSNPSFQQLQL